MPLQPLSSKSLAVSAYPTFNPAFLLIAHFADIERLAIIEDKQSHFMFRSYYNCLVSLFCIRSILRSVL